MSSVTSDAISCDSLPPQYSAQEGFFILSGNKSIPGHTGHKLPNLSLKCEEESHSAPASVCLCVFACQV